MKRPAALRAADLRGLSRLGTEATLGLVDLVEAVHQRVASLPGFTRADGRSSGLTGLVYRSIRGVTRLAGGGIEGLLALLARDLQAPADAAATVQPEREALLAALNGVLGDRLAASANPLALPMSLRQQGRALGDDAPADAGPRLLLLIHGLCMNDLQWQREGHDHGRALAEALGYTPVYLHYNSGLPVGANGLALAQLLDRYLRSWPQPLQRFAILGHSMGGLVARSAIHQAGGLGMDWPQRLDDLICLGTPHLGAPLERAGHWVDILLGATPYAAPFARLGQLRSAGITDLRHGQLLLDEAGADRFSRQAPPPVTVPLPRGTRSHALAGTLGQASGGVKTALLGDGLVPLDSALGRHPDPQRCLAFPPERQWVGEGLGHLALLSDAAVFERLRQILA
jgi:hypothetical protein